MNLNQNNEKQTDYQSRKRQSGRPEIDMTLQNAHGEIPYGMTNDYMFRAVLQSNNKVLRGLICSLLHLTEEEIVSVEITNPIILGKSLTDKEIRLDINVLLNNRTIINLEMQIANRLNWQNRSVMYLCRSFDNLNHGQNYEEIKPAIHIGFLDYTLFSDNPEFYASYKLINVKNYQKYSDNITLNVVDLSRIDLATEEDRRYHIDDWAALFKATTWEEVKMLASKDEYMNEAANTIFQFSTDDQVRKMCRDREEYYQDLRNYERAISDQELTISSYKKALSDRELTISSYEKTLSDQELTISSYEKTLSDQELTISSYEKTLSDQEMTISSYKKAISEKDAQIQQLLAENERLRGHSD